MLVHFFEAETWVILLAAFTLFPAFYTCTTAKKANCRTTDNVSSYGHMTWRFPGFQVLWFHKTQETIKTIKNWKLNCQIADVHAGGIHVGCSPWPMNHASLDGFEQWRLILRIWPLCPNARVDCMVVLSLYGSFNKMRMCICGSPCF